MYDFFMLLHNTYKRSKMQSEKKGSFKDCSIYYSCRTLEFIHFCSYFQQREMFTFLNCCNLNSRAATVEFWQARLDRVGHIDGVLPPPHSIPQNQGKTWVLPDSSIERVHKPNIRSKTPQLSNLNYNITTVDNSSLHLIVEKLLNTDKIVSLVQIKNVLAL